MGEGGTSPYQPLQAAERLTSLSEPALLNETRKHKYEGSNNPTKTAWSQSNFNNLALIATMIVLRDIRIAPRAGVMTTPWL